MVKLLVDWCWRHTDTCSEITKCIVEVLVSDRAVNSGASWILLLPWWYIEDGRNTFFCQLDNLSGGQWSLLVKISLMYFAYVGTCMASSRGMLKYNFWMTSTNLPNCSSDCSPLFNYSYNDDGHLMSNRGHPRWTKRTHDIWCWTSYLLDEHRSSPLCSWSSYPKSWSLCASWSYNYSQPSLVWILIFWSWRWPIVKASATIVVVKSVALKILVLRANWLVASNKANIKQGNDGLIAMMDIFHQLVNQTLELRDVLQSGMLQFQHRTSLVCICSAYTNGAYWS